MDQFEIIFVRTLYGILFRAEMELGTSFGDISEKFFLRLIKDLRDFGLSLNGATIPSKENLQLHQLPVKYSGTSPKLGRR